MFAAWALGVYTQRVEWADKAGTADQAPGELAKRTDQIKRLQEARDQAEKRLETASVGLRRLEQQRVSNLAWYAQQLKDLETGQTATVVVYNKGVLRIDPQTQRPVLDVLRDSAGQPIPSRTRMQQTFAQLQASIQAEMQSLDQLVKQEKDLTTEINGDGQAVKGIRPQLAQERQAYQHSLAEQEYLEPLVLNRQVEAGILQKRQKSLESRLKELQTLGATARRP